MCHEGKNKKQKTRWFNTLFCVNSFNVRHAIHLRVFFRPICGTDAYQVCLIWAHLVFTQFKRICTQANTPFCTGRCSWKWYHQLTQLWVVWNLCSPCYSSYNGRWILPGWSNVNEALFLFPLLFWLCLFIYLCLFIFVYSITVVPIFPLCPLPSSPPVLPRKRSVGSQGLVEVLWHYKVLHPKCIMGHFLKVFQVTWRLAFFFTVPYLLFSAQ